FPRGRTVMVPCFHWLLYFSVTARIASLKILLLKEPHSPRSELITIRRIFFSCLTLLYQPDSPSLAEERLRKMALSFWAKGRICWILSCERRSLAAATIFMAFVICCVETTELILFFTSFKLAILL